MSVPVHQIVHEALSDITTAINAPIPPEHMDNANDSGHYAALLEEKIQRIGVATKLLADIAKDQEITWSQLQHLNGLIQAASLRFEHAASAQ